MAEVSQVWTSRQTRAQFAAIARLRWRVLLNGFRRKGGFGDLMANIIIAPIALVFIFGPAIGAGALTWYALAQGHDGYLMGVLWGVFALSQFANIQLGQPGTTFDPTQLIRFPLNFRGYAAIRLFFGLISPANVTATMMSLGVAVGGSIAAPGAAIYFFVAMGAFALANIFFTRMVFAWVDRWLATRRTREIFTALIVIGSLGIQWANVTFNPGFHNSERSRAASLARVTAAKGLYHHIKPLLEWLPPGLASDALLSAAHGQHGAYLLRLFGVVVFAAIFFTVFALRLQKEFRGEVISEAAIAVAATPPPPARTGARVQAGAVPALQGAGAATVLSGFDAVSTLFSKELLTLRRNTGIFYGLIAPLVMLVILAGRFAGHTAPGPLFGIGVAYCMLGVAGLSYNAFGTEGAGVQFFFMAPISMRHVFLAKNLFNAMIALLEIVAVFVAISFLRHAPSLLMTLAVLLWAAFTLLLSMTIGNRRSITTPKKIDPQRPAGKQASALSGLLSIGLLLASALLGACVYLMAMYFGQAWILLVGAVVLAAIGVALYVASLSALDGLLAKHRETLIEELCKAS